MAPGPLLLIAGPGAGKTKTLIHRIARRLATRAAVPWEILAVTFSVRAAGELRLRLADLLGEQVARGVSAATFHSICARMLREHAGVFGRTERYTIYDQADMRRVIEWLLSDQQRGQIQRALADYGQPAAAEVLAEISLAKNRLLSPETYQPHAPHRAAPLIATIWRETELELQRSNAMDFDDLLVFAVRLLAEHPHRLAFYRAGAGGDRAPGARQPRALRALRGPRRARLSRAAGQSGRRAGVPAIGWITPPRRRRRDRQPGDRAGPRRPPGGFDRRQRSRAPDRQHPLPRGPRPAEKVRGGPVAGRG
jgi:UvrD/REP helicase N-terminal domain